jgi:hypothetical protein
LNEVELAWCIAQVTGLLLQQVDLTPWREGSLLTPWLAECAAARACGTLSANRLATAEHMAAIDEATAIALTHPEKSVQRAAADGLGSVASAASIQLAACELMIMHSRLCRNVDLRHRGPQCMAFENIQTWQDQCSAMHEEILTGTRLLRGRFVKGEPPDLRRLTLFYPRGQEDEQSLCPILATLLQHNSTTAAAVFERARNWLAIQFIDDGDHGSHRRKFAADAWRDQNGSSSRGDPVNTGAVSGLVAIRVLGMTPTKVRQFYAPIFRSSRICQLRGKAGTFLKDLCIKLEAQDPAAFWAAWEVCVVAAAELGSELNNKEHWLRLKVSPQSAQDTFRALVSAVFLNHMYFRVNQSWRPLDGQVDRFTNAFHDFNVFGLNDYIAFLDTIGGSLLPDALRGVSDCVRKLIKLTGKSFLTPADQSRLMGLLAK